MALWRLYYHIVWATKEREPFVENSQINKMDSIGLEPTASPMSRVRSNQLS